ncbi:MAG: shikimate dehydrogenase [Rhodocyclaceae bacterium]|nr:shikimate dehydrogenase [Rhodocyclaceae bacterium]
MSYSLPDRYVVIGNPIAHSKSPRIHHLFAAQTGQLLDYATLLAPLDGFAASVRSFIAGGGRGANVTVPFKEEAFQLANQLSPRARAAGAVNTLRFESSGNIYGDNTDGAGLVRDITVNLHRSLNGKRVLLLGAGGAARGVILPLLLEGPARLYIANRTAAKAVALVSEFNALPNGELGRLDGGSFNSLTGQQFDVIINATSAGLSDSPLDLPDDLFAAQSLAYDMVYGRNTPFMQQACAAGAEIADGLGMLVEQAAEAFYIWRDVRPDTLPVMQALRAG